MHVDCKFYTFACTHHLLSLLDLFPVIREYTLVLILQKSLGCKFSKLHRV